MLFDKGFTRYRISASLRPLREKHFLEQAHQLTGIALRDTPTACLGELHSNFYNNKNNIIFLKTNTLILLFLISCVPVSSISQTLQDDFEGNGNISAWVGDNCNINVEIDNPFPQGINNSSKILRYHDVGGAYANLRFQNSDKLDLTYSSVFTLKIYIPSNGLTGNQNNQVSLKLQNGALNEPWTTQTEIIKSVGLDQWQLITFDFVNDDYASFDQNSGAPRYRTDFDRVLIQINGENNTDQVVAYLDDFYYQVNTPNDPVYDQLVWSDEFAEDGPIDNEKWFHQTKIPSGGSWYNGEVQHYTDRTENSIVENGVLRIIAKKENFTDQGVTKNYTSARLNSKFAFQYGKVEIRAKLPTGQGTWPALWTLGKNITENGAYWQTQGFGTTSWPACGEIDIMEHWGRNQNFVQSAMHTPSSNGNTQNKGGRIIPTASSDFHLYCLEWSAEKMVFKIDGVIHYIYDPVNKNMNNWPFDAEQYLLMNFAVESVIEPGFIEDAMEIDYVRVYQEASVATTSIEKNTPTHFYPNPVTDELNIELPPSDIQNIKLEIFSANGSRIQASVCPIVENIATLRNLADLPNNIYLAVYQLNRKKYFLKFVKQ